MMARLRVGRVEGAFCTVIAAVVAFPIGASGQDVPEWTLGDRPALDIGEGGDPAAESSRVEGAVQLSDGSYVIADAGTGELRFFDPRGSHVRTVGGAGSEPGTFEAIRGLALAEGDTLVVADRALDAGAVGAMPSLRYRFSLLTAAGELVRVEETPAMPLFAGLHFRLHPGGLATVWGSDRSPTTRGVHRTMSTVRLLDPRTARADTVGEFPGSESVATGPPQSASGPRPYGRTLAVAADANGRVFLGTGDGREIVVLSPRGEEEGTLVVPGEPARLDAAQRAEALQALSRRFQGVDLTGFEELVPERAPMYRSMRLDAQGRRLWVEQYRDTAEGSDWWIYDTESLALVAQARTPDADAVLGVGSDYLLVRAGATSGPPTVQVWRFEPR